MHVPGKRLRPQASHNKISSADDRAKVPGEYAAWSKVPESGYLEIVDDGPPAPNWTY
jgi:hypothetical protein